MTKWTTIAISMRERGDEVPDIARQLGVAPQSVYHALKRHAPHLSPKKERQIACASCGGEITATHAMQKYCRPCSDRVGRERHRNACARYTDRNRLSENKRSREHARRTSGRVKEKTEEAGRQLSDKTTITEVGASPEVAWVVRIKVPFTYAASKNHIYGYGSHVFRRGQSRQFEDALAAKMKSALGSIQPVQTKTWIGLHVEKPNQRGDAINAVDLVCDALKKAIEVDDRWFSISYVDWSINKNDPQLFVEVAQESLEPEQACSSCGRVLTFEHFTKKSNTKNGIDRTCKECRRIGRQMAKEAAQ